MNKLGDRDRHKDKAKPTQHKPIFESRAVYTASGSKIGNWARRLLEFVSGLAGAERAQQNQVGQAKLAQHKPIFKSLAV